MLLRIFLALLVQCPPAYSGNRVGFLEITSPSGRPLILEEGGRFAHVAIAFGDQWLHAFPNRGVELISTEALRKIGRMTAIVELPESPILTFHDIRPFLGRPYDHDFRWTNQKFYCSELIAQLLGIPPRPMVFSPKLWPPTYQRLNGLPGMSPDGLFQSLGLPQEPRRHANRRKKP